MRIDFEDDDLRRLYEEHDLVLPRIGPEVTKAYRKTVGFLVAAPTRADLREYRALRLKKLQGDRQGQHSVRLNRQWRLIIRFETDTDGQLLIVIEVVDYH
ncbi:type II toxin-antitoxin system RelE/ParE family toxin [Candidatus Poriferisodalis sp.]|uniref:type II toxin-antitoxin system RelE/ParE family toxin n=1 Tax=Candidatus Poriferisodalis sp. TaxID=3101277 RepID=UPI003B02E14F